MLTKTNDGTVTPAVRSQGATKTTSAKTRRPRAAATARGHAEALAAPHPGAGSRREVWTVRPGDTLWGIAANVLGDGSRWGEIYALNRDQVSNPSLIYPGQVLRLPRGSTAPEAHEPARPPAGQQTGGASKKDQKPTRDVAREEASGGDTFVYVVQPSDSLALIARTQLGDESRWREIWNLNREVIPNPSIIRAGQRLKLPGKGPVAPAAGTRRQTPSGGGPGGTLDPATLTPAQRVAYNVYKKHHEFLVTQAERLGFDVEIAAAVLITESSGTGFGADGRLKIRFEPHIFKGYTGRVVPDSHKSQDAEYEAFEAAKKIDRDAAFKSISMGAAQIMGFNAGTLGYGSAEAMFEAFSKGERPQIEGLFAFIEKHPALVKAAKQHDWATFAAGYNGPAYAKYSYDTRLAAYFEAYRHVLDLVKKSGTR